VSRPPQNVRRPLATAEEPSAFQASCATAAARTPDGTASSWATPPQDAISLVATAPQRYRTALTRHGEQLIRTPTVLPWAAISYLWHLADARTPLDA
jgi:hypothetical protein